MITPCEDLPNADELNKELDKVRADIFKGSNSAFLGPLLCTLEFVWSESVPTAATNGLTLWWNPKWFMSLTREVRGTVFLHELWHIARMHMIRQGSRSNKEWNWACDIRINNDLENMGHKFTGTMPWKDQTFGDTPEEDIYDILIQRKAPPSHGPWGGSADDSDLIPLEEHEKRAIVQNVVQAQQSAKRSGNPGHIPGDIETLINKFLAPIIPWESILNQFFTDLMEDIYSWRRPNRRYQDMYLPALCSEEGRLEHLIYYLDVSGSVTDAEILRFNSEVKFIKEKLNPKKLTLVQFDTRITKEISFDENDVFEAIPIVGRGGTDLAPVRAHIIKHEPTAAVVFSDLYCTPMDIIPNMPIIWVAVNNKAAAVQFGKLIHIKA